MVKDKPTTLFQNMEDSFRFLKTADFDGSLDISHELIVKRKCTLITHLAQIEQLDKWDKLTVLVKIESERTSKASGKV
ncbi:MAG: hypothetical protein H7096_08930 [Flavobacterium sp.]|nr:hypothetical protein [Pedobacter sp.]